MRILQLLALGGFVSIAAFCQTPGVKPLAFEVATIKTSEPMTGGRMVMIGPRNDGAMVTYTRMSLKSLVREAYGVKDYQVTGAEWMDSLQFDISAKIPDGGSKADAPEMLKSLLKERFDLKVHIEKKDHAIYALVVGKGGPKLKAAEIGPAAAPPPGATAAPLPPPPPGAGPGRGPGGPGGPLPAGGMRMMMGPNGGHIEARASTWARFAETISRFMDRPVIDQTGIDGTYDFSLDISSEEMANMMAQMRAAMPMAGRGGPGPAGGGPEGPAEYARRRVGFPIDSAVRIKTGT